MFTKLVLVGTVVFDDEVSLTATTSKSCSITVMLLVLNGADKK